MFGFSRGGRGAIELCIQHAMLFDGAVCLGAYAATKGESQQEHEAWALVCVNIPILMVHGANDAFCRHKYFKWHLRLDMAMRNPPGDKYGTRVATFASFVVPDDHDFLEQLFCHLTFHHLANPEIDGFWRAMLRNHVDDLH